MMEDDVIPVAISRDGNYIAVGDGNGFLYLFHRSQSTPLWNYKTGTSVHSLAFSSDGNYLVVGILNQTLKIIMRRMIILMKHHS